MGTAGARPVVPLLDFLPHRVSHPLAPDQVQMQVKHRLPAVRTRVRDQAIAAFGNVLPGRDLPGGEDHMAHQRLILRLHLVQRPDVSVRGDQDVRRRDGMDIAKGGHELVMIDDACTRFMIYHFAEDAGISHARNRP